MEAHGSTLESRHEEVGGNETRHAQEQPTQEVAAAAQKLWSQYSNRAATPGRGFTPGRTPRSVGSTPTPRSQSTFSHASLPDLHAQAVASSRCLETELAVMSGLSAEVSARQAEVSARQAAGCAYGAKGSSSPSKRSVRYQLAIPSSRFPRQASEGEPAAAEAARGGRTAAPVGARHRPQTRDEASMHLGDSTLILKDIEWMRKRLSLALSSTENFICGLQEMRASRRRLTPTGNEDFGRQSPRTRSSSTQSIRRREGSLQRPDNRQSSILRSLCIRMKDSEELCREARRVSARVLHALTVEKAANDAKNALSSHPLVKLDENGAAGRGGVRTKSFSPPRRFRSTAVD